MPGSILGNRVVRKEDPKFLTTGGMYLDDLNDVAELGGAAYVAYVRSSRRPRHDHVDRHVRRRRRCPACVGVFTAADLELQPVPSPFNPAVAKTLLASDRVRYVGEPIAAVVAETREQAADAADAVLVDYDSARRLRRPAGRPHRHDAAVRRRRQQRRVRLDGPRHARPHRRRVLRRLRGHRLRHVRQPARRPVPAGGPRLGGDVDRRPAAPVGLDPARPGDQGPDRRRQRRRRRAGAHHHARRRRRLRRQDQHVPGGDRPRPDRQARSAGRCAGRRPAASR